ncbi:MAG: 2-5 ligase [Verrucomicrobiales bacterium]|nr:2-5 ligase [Verrucomicrobiales bacterium]
MESLEDLRDKLRDELPDPAVRWSKQLHLTTQFLDTIDDARVGEYAAAIRKACAGTKPFTLCCAGMGCFPTARQPRVIWAGLSGEMEALATLKTALDNALAGFGYVAEKRAFKPHLTIARVRELNTRQRQRMPKLVEQFQETKFGEWRVNRVELMQSVLSPKGAQYKLVEFVQL